VYELQSASISRKHTEIIIRQMFSRRRIKDAGETNFSVGDIVENTALIEENMRVAKTEGKGELAVQAKGETIVLGITEFRYVLRVGFRLLPSKTPTES